MKNEGVMGGGGQQVNCDCGAARCRGVITWPFDDSATGLRRVKRMKDVLHWYAARKGCGHYGNHGWVPYPIDDDAGARARVALAQTGEE